MSKLLVGRYELVEKIGEGGMAVVYKAKDRLLNRFVAVKILRPECTKDAQFVDSFRAESQAAAGLQHPNIISVYDVGREGNIHFIVMELIEGKSLSEVIKEQAPMDYREVVRITKQVASALSVAHKHNIIHRDIKPHNIMMTTDGMAKLGDFGIAKALSDSTMEETSKIIGSVHYISPEQARGAYVDERSDIYSLGIVMYEMLTGRVPFDGDSPVQVALMHINDDITPPSELVPGIPPQLEKVVMKATNKFQTNRYASADEMLKDLDSIEYVSNVMGRNAFANQQEERKAQPVQQDAQDRTPYAAKNKKQGLSPKARRAIAAAVLIALLAVIGVFAVPKLMGSGNKVTVPDVTDMSYSQAKTTLSGRGLKIKKGTSIASDSIDKGKVAAQDPSSGEKVKKGSTVTVRLSKGNSNGEVPDLVGQTYDSSTKDIIEAAGFNLGDVTYAYSDSYDKGEIMSQTPSGGSKASSGTDIDLVVSKGAKKDKSKDSQDSSDTAEVPSVTGMSVSEARAKLAAAGFNVSVTYEESNLTTSGQVISQSVSAGSKAKKGSTVTITVSKASSSDNNNSDNNSDNSNSNNNNSNSNNSSSDSNNSSNSGSNSSGGTTDSTDSSTSRSSGNSSSSASSSPTASRSASSPSTSAASSAK
ncbi:MAG: Stk1 family PASTA domain-containing Ser/Thr kinase [Eubacterium sp.]